ncbi:hypothetical protein [Streptomyces sp. 6N223]
MASNAQPGLVIQPPRSIPTPESTSSTGQSALKTARQASAMHLP